MSVTKQSGRFPCTALLKDGSPCGRYYKKGDPEPFCSVHRKDFKPTGAAVPRPKPVTHHERLRRFAESSDPRVAMQAIGILERRAEGGSKQDANSARRAFIDALADDERAQLQTILAQYKELQRVVYRRRPDLPRPDGLFVADAVAAPEPTEACEDVLEEAPSPAPAPDGEASVGADDDGWEEI
jgi:hypothetical protein